MTLEQFSEYRSTCIFTIIAIGVLVAIWIVKLIFSITKDNE